MSHDKKLTTDEEVARIEQALLALPARTRAVFLLHRLDGLSCGEIAARYRISDERVGAHIAEAMLAIDRALEHARRPWWRRWLDRPIEMAVQLPIRSSGQYLARSSAASSAVIAPIRSAKVIAPGSRRRPSSSPGASLGRGPDSTATGLGVAA